MIPTATPPTTYLNQPPALADYDVYGTDPILRS